MNSFRNAAQVALEALKNNVGEMRVEGAISILETALAQPAEPFTPDAIRTTQTAWKMGYDAAKAETQPAEPQITHSAECWRWHHGCAVAKIERECKHD